MFNKSADIYDAIYQNKDYDFECEKINRLLKQHGSNDAKSLLDVACGTGLHAEKLKDRYVVEGLDIEPTLLERARERNPGIKFHEGDMADFSLGKKYDLLTCLFSSIGYVGTEDRLRSALTCMHQHLNPGGLLLLEPWFSPATYFGGRIHAIFVNHADLKIARMNLSSIEGDLSVLNFQYMVGTADGIDSFSERHELALFTHEQYMDALQHAGFTNVLHDPVGLMDHGLYIAKRK